MESQLLLGDGFLETLGPYIRTLLNSLGTYRIAVFHKKSTYQTFWVKGEKHHRRNKSTKKTGKPKQNKTKQKKTHVTWNGFPFVFPVFSFVLHQENIGTMERHQDIQSETQEVALRIDLSNVPSSLGSQIDFSLYQVASKSTKFHKFNEVTEAESK